MLIQQQEMSKNSRSLERYWLLVPLALVGVIALVILEATLLNLSASEPVLALEQVVDIPLAGGPTRFDYQSLDPNTGMLFIAHPGANMVTVFNTRSKKVTANISNILHVHGVLAVAGLGRAYATDADDNQVYVIDEHTMRVIATVPTGSGPDGLAYDSTSHQLYVSDEGGHSDTVIDALKEKQVGIIPLGGEAGNTQYDSLTNRIYVNVQTLNQLVAIDPKSDRIVGRYPLPAADCDHNHGLALDTAQGMAFIACDVSNTLLLVDLHTMQVLSTQSVGKGPDVLALDFGRHYLYVASESGVVSVFDEHGRALRKVTEGFVATDAHSIAVNPETHALYFPLEDINNQPVLRIALFQPPV